MRRRKAKKRVFAGDQASQRQDNQNSQPNLLLPVYYSELMDRVPTEEEVDDLIRSFTRTPSFFLVSMLNVLLSFYRDDRKAFTDVQRLLFRTLTDEALFERARQRLGPANMGLRPMFHRQQMLLMMKKVLLLSEESGRTNPNETNEGKYALGKLALMTNDLMNTEQQTKRLEEQKDDRILRNEFCTQMLPTYELSNPPDVIPALVRNHEYLRIFDEFAAEGRLLFSDGDSVPARFFKITGLTIRDYLLMILAVFLNYKAISTRDDALQQLITNPGNFNIDVNIIFRKMRFTEDERRAFFAQNTTDLKGLVEACQIIRSPKHELMQHYDFTAFREYPFVFTREARDIVTCLDFAFLAEKISTGVYFTIKKPLETEAAVSDSARRDHDNYLGYWGEVFEQYVNDRLNETKSIRLRKCFISPFIDDPPSRTDTQAFDAVLDYGDALVVMEHKGKYLDLGAKYSGDRDVFISELVNRNRIGKGIYQLADNLQMVFNNAPDGKRHTFHERDAERRITKQFQLADARRIKRVYPLIVHQDFSLGLNCVRSIMADCFAEEVAKRNIDPALVGPLSLLSIEDLEIVLPYLIAIPLSDILDDYGNQDDPLMTFQRAFRSLRKRRHTAARRNNWIDQKSDEILEEMKDAYIDLSE